MATAVCLYITISYFISLLGWADRAQTVHRPFREQVLKMKDALYLSAAHISQPDRILMKMYGKSSEIKCYAVVAVLLIFKVGC